MRRQKTSRDPIFATIAAHQKAAAVCSAKPPWHRYVGTRLLIVFRIHYSRQLGAYVALRLGAARICDLNN